MSRKIQHLQELEIFPTEKTFVKLTRLHSKDYPLGIPLYPNQERDRIECGIGHKDPCIGNHKFVVNSKSMSYAKRKALEVLRSGRVWRIF